MPSVKYSWLILSVITLLYCQTGFAKNSQSLQTIADEANAFISEQIAELDGEIEFSVKPLDRRLKLADCSDHLEAFLPRGSRLEGHTSIGVKCQHPDKYWIVYLSAKIKIFKPVVITRIPIERGHTISAADVTTQVMETSRLRASYFTSPEQVIGKVSSRRFAIGSPLSSSAVKAPNLVKRGETVTIVALINTIKVRMTGKAMANGKAGDIVKVKNTNSQRIIEATVIRAGVVQVRI